MYYLIKRTNEGSVTRYTFGTDHERRANKALAILFVQGWVCGGGGVFTGIVTSRLLG